VARALELLEDHVVHARAGIDERGRDDRERAAALARVDLARTAEESLRLLERVRVQAARQRLAGAALVRVVGPGEARDTVEDDDDVLAHLDAAARPLERHLRD